MFCLLVFLLVTGRDARFIECEEKWKVSSQVASGEKVNTHQLLCSHRQLEDGIQRGMTPNLLTDITDIQFSVVTHPSNKEAHAATIKIQNIYPYEDLNVTYTLKFTAVTDRTGNKELDIPTFCELISISTFMTDSKWSQGCHVLTSSFAPFVSHCARMDYRDTNRDLNLYITIIVVLLDWLGNLGEEYCEIRGAWSLGVIILTSFEKRNNI